MRITVTRTGGLGGQTVRAALDSHDVPDAPELMHLAQEAFSTCTAHRPVGEPEGFRYEIDLEGEAAYCAEPRLSDAQRALIARVLHDGR